MIVNREHRCVVIQIVIRQREQMTYRTCSYGNCNGLGPKFAVLVQVVESNNITLEERDIINK